METKSLLSVSLKEDKLLTYKQAFQHLLTLGVPLFAQQHLKFLQFLVSFSFIAYLNSPEVLGGLGLAISFYVLVVMAPFMGLDSAITTFSTQLQGMGRGQDIIKYLNGARLMNLIISIPMIVLLQTSGWIFLYLGQESEIAYQASRYLIGLIPGLLCIGMNELHVLYMNSYQKTMTGLMSIIAGLFTQILVTSTFVWYWEMGLLGVGLGVSFANIIQCLFTYSMINLYNETREEAFLPPFTREQCTYIYQFLIMGIPSFVMVIIALAGIELIGLLAGQISPSSNGAQAVASNIYAGIFAIYYTVQHAASIQIGNQIGKCNILQAKTYMRTATYFNVAVSILIFVVLKFIKDGIILKYIDDSEIQKLADDAIDMMSLVIIPESIILVQVGALRGLGKLKIAALISILSILLISLPLGYLFAIKMKLAGFWLGYLIRSVIVSLIFWYLLSVQYDWEAISCEAKNREDKNSINQLLYARPRSLSQNNSNNSHYGSTQDQQSH